MKQDTLGDNHIAHPNASPKSARKTKQEIVDSWEDEDSNEEVQPRIKAKDSGKRPSAPIASDYAAASSAWTTNSPGTSFAEDDESASRPEKTDAVARRMIAASLGLKAPKQTQEQKDYQKSIREQERKRREQEKLEQQRRREEGKKAKAAIWDD